MIRFTTTINGILVIDHGRGVIYFHSDDCEPLPTILRICSLPTPIPNPIQELLDITHMHGCSWKGKK